MLYRRPVAHRPGVVWRLDGHRIQAAADWLSGTARARARHRRPALAVPVSGQGV